VNYSLENWNEIMKKTTKVAESSELYRNIHSLELSAIDRAEAFNALRLAEGLVGAIAYLVGLVSTPASPNSKLKHQ
jgi:hypothetical protein